MGLFDVQSPLYNRTRQGVGGLGDHEGELYPITRRSDCESGTDNPAKDQPCKTQLECLQCACEQLKCIASLIRTLPDEIVLAMQTKLQTPPRERISFIPYSGDIAIATGVTTTILTFTLQERESGQITNIGFNVSPSGQFNQVAWALTIGNMTYPGFDAGTAKTVFGNSLATPLPFVAELASNRVVTLKATNNGAGTTNVQAMMCYWLEYLNEAKKFGTQPASGVA